MLKPFLIVVHILVSLFLIAVVLLQTGKRADLAGAFGGGGSQTAFGARGTATVLSKLTTTFAVVFMLSSITLALVTANEGSSKSTLDALPQTQTIPDAPLVAPPEPGEEGANASPVVVPPTGGDVDASPVVVPPTEGDDSGAN